MTLREPILDAPSLEVLQQALAIAGKQMSLIQVQDHYISTYKRINDAVTRAYGWLENSNGRPVFVSVDRNLGVIGSGYADDPNVSDLTNPKKMTRPIMSGIPSEVIVNSLIHEYYSGPVKAAQNSSTDKDTGS